VAVDALFIALALVWSLDVTAIKVAQMSPGKSLGVLLLSVAVCLWCFYFFDVYDLDSTSAGHDVLLRVLRSLGCGILLLVPVWWFLLPPGSHFRGLEVALVVFLMVLYAYRLVTEWVRHQFLPGERVLLIGSGNSIQLLAKTMREKLGLPLRLMGVVPHQFESCVPDLKFAVCGHLGEFDQIMGVLKPNRVVIGSEPDVEGLPAEKLVEVRRRGVRVDDAANLYEEITGRVPVELITSETLAFGEGFRTSRFIALVQRAGGAVIAPLLMLILSPIFLLIAILIKLDSRGPIFYKQERVGLHEKPFKTIKFRSMRTDSEQHTGPIWASKQDSRVTRVGKLIRTLRLDELPQLWNVAKGEMAIVGPRPERPHFVASLRLQIPFYDLRHTISPGITGWAQVCAGYGANVEESREKLEYDLFYLKHRSPLFDTLILFKTVKIMVFGRGAR
jgi:exopolysaccharide biosynthesis polyprenyl glycosylphosphotransferase